MPRPALPRRSDLQGAARLATDATTGLTDLVEAMHARIGQASHHDRTRTRGITGLVYRSVRGVTRLVGAGLDTALSLPPAGPDTPGSPGRDALLAALNGVLGDHLARSSNPLATTMSLRHDGRALDPAVATLAQALPTAGPRLLILLHGLCMNDLQWRRAGHDHGAALARDAGYTCVYLRYNSGLHVADNGLALAVQLESLIAQWPVPLERVVLLGHSMGGLVARSALHQGAQAGHRWPAQVSDLVCLGTPHHGAPLERAGHWIDILLGAAPYAAPLARLGQVRSAGITDLRHGNLLPQDGAGVGRFASAADRRTPVPLPTGVRCHAVAATLAPKAARLKDRVLGDGLVPLDSALGRHADAARVLSFEPQRQWVGRGMGHLDLLNRPEVYEVLKRWLA